MAEADDLRREALYAKWGRPRLLDETERNVFAFGHASREAAEAFADSNRTHQGYPAWVEERDGVWASVVDLRPAMAEVDAQFKDSMTMSITAPQDVDDPAGQVRRALTEAPRG